MTTTRLDDAEPTTEPGPRSGGVVQPSSLGVPSGRDPRADENAQTHWAPRASDDPFDYRDETDRNAMNED